MFTKLMWNSLYTRRRIRDTCHHVSKNSTWNNAHQLACHHHQSRCAHQTPIKTQTTNPISHLHAIPAFILPTLFSTVERTYRGNCRRIYLRSVTESRYPSHSIIDIRVDCISVNHGLPAFLFNALIIVLISLL